MSGNLWELLLLSLCAANVYVWARFERPLSAAAAVATFGAFLHEVLS